VNASDNLERIARHFPNEPAVFENGKEISYAEFYRDVTRTASALSVTGVSPGDHIALCAPNSYEWLVFYFGVLKAGAVAVTFSPVSSQREIQTYISTCNPKLILTTDEKLQALEGLKTGGALETVVCDHGDMTFSALMQKGVPSFDTIQRDRHDTAAILYTGGTTGTPKGAMLTHGNLLTSAFNVARYERSTRKDRALLFLPLNHVFAQVHIMHSLIFVGGALVVQNGFDIENTLHAIEHYDVSNFYAVPTIYVRLLELKELKNRLRSVRYCFSAASSMAMEVVREWHARTGLKIYESYGMTESAAIVTYNHYYHHVVGSVGTPVNMVEIEIRDQNGQTVSQGEKGEICIRGQNIFKGYLNNPVETAAAFWSDNWFRSGDIGFLDEKGYLFIADRLKDIIITGGENVYPREVEEIIYTFPGVLECAVVGLADMEYGEKVTAFVVSQHESTVDPVEIKGFLKKQLSGFKVPKQIIIVDEIPKSSTGKLLKRKLRKYL